jgi:lipoate-protein ligase B
MSKIGPCLTISKFAPKSMLFLPPKGLTSYEHASTIQEAYVRRWLDFKAARGTTGVAPQPLLLAFEMNPVYTCGRRQVGRLSLDEIEYLKADGQAEFIEAQRGGQTTFHGPGQLVLYPIIDLKSFGIQVRCYVRLLETTIIETLESYGIKAFCTEDTGVWVSNTEKIAAIGIHVRRSITSHGLALNVNTDPFWFNRIVACGLPDKSTTTMAMRGVDVTVGEVASKLAGRLASNLSIKRIEETDEIPLIP